MNRYLLLILFASFCFILNSKYESPKCKIIDNIRLNKKELEKASEINYKLLKELYFLPRLKNEDIHFCNEYIFIKELNGSKVIALDTEGGRPEEIPDIFIFDINQFIPLEVKERYEACYELGSFKESPIEHIQMMVNKSLKLPSKYFQTEKGLRLGTNVNEVLKLYGKPDLIEIISFKKKILKFKWEVYGSEYFDYFKIIPTDLICPKIYTRYKLYITFIDGKVSVINIGYAPL